MSWQYTLPAQKARLLHKNKCDQQVEGGNSAPLLHSDETLPGGLHPALGPPVQEGHGPAGVSPEECHKNGQKTGTPLL